MGFFPEAAMHRFLVRSCERGEIINDACWRTGAVLQVDSATAAVQSEPDSGQVTVWIKKTRRDLRSPQPAELDVLNNIYHRLTDLIGRKPDQETRSWEDGGPPPDVADESERAKWLVRLIAEHGVSTNDSDLKKFVSAFLSLTASTIKGDIQRTCFRGWYISTHVLGHSPASRKRATYENICNDLNFGQSDKALWQCFGDKWTGLGRDVKKNTAFERSVRHVLDNHKEVFTELNRLNPFRKVSPRKETAAPIEDITGEQRGNGG